MVDEARQVPGVIDVRMRDDTSVDRSGIERRFLPIAIAQIVTALKQTTINKHPRAI